MVISLKKKKEKANINKIKGALVLNCIFSETTHESVLTCRISRF